MKIALRILGIVVLVLGLGYLAVEWFANRHFQQSLDEELAEIEDQVAVEYDGFRFRLWQRDYLIRNLRAEPEFFPGLILVDQVRVTCKDYDINLQTVRDLQVNVNGVRFHRWDEETGESYSMFRRLGYEDPRLEMNLDYAFDPETRLLTMRHLNLGHEQIGKMELQLQLQGLQMVEVDQWSSTESLAQITSLLSSLTLHSAEVHYQDMGYMPRVIQTGAENAGMSEEAYIEQLITRSKLLRYARVPPSMIEVLEEFLRDPDKIRIVADPPAPVNSMVLAGGMILGASPADIFGLQIRN